MRVIATLLIGLLPMACGGAAIPQSELTSAKAAVSGAEVAGAAEEPTAALHLKLAKEQLAQAEAQIAEDDNELAIITIERAQADADLALALAKEAKSKAEAMDTKEQLDRLRKHTGT